MPPGEYGARVNRCCHGDGAMPTPMFDRAFQDLTSKEREHLLATAEHMTYGPGDVVIEEGTMPEAIFVITEGKVRVTRGLSAVMSAEFAGPLGLGEIVGEMSMVDGNSASATLVADGEVKALRVAAAEVEKMIEADPTFAGRFYRSLLLAVIRRMRRINERVLLPFT